MITLLEGVPDNVLAVSATGQVTCEDSRDVLICEARSRSRRHDELRVLFPLGGDSSTSLRVR